MVSCRLLCYVRMFALILLCVVTVSIAKAQGAKQSIPQNPIPVADADHVEERNEWFFRGRIVPGKPTAEFRRRAYQAKVRMRAQRAAALAVAGATWTGHALLRHMDASGPCAVGV